MQRHRPVAFDVNLGCRTQGVVRGFPVFPDEEEEVPAVLRALDVAPPRRRIGTGVVLRLPVEELGTSRRPSGLATAQVACARRASQSRMTAQVGLFCALLLNSSERQRGLTSICPGVELARK